MPYLASLRQLINYYGNSFLQAKIVDRKQQKTRLAGGSSSAGHSPLTLGSRMASSRLSK